MTMPVEVRRRVVVTGMGVVSSIGVGVDEFADGLRSGRSGASPITAFDASEFPSDVACEVRGFEPDQWIHTVPAKSLGRASQFAVAAARMAVDDAGGDSCALGDRRGLVVIGTTNGESQDLDRLAEIEVAEGAERMDPALVDRVSAQNLALSVARELRLSDVDAYVIGTACSAGNYAIGDAVDAVRLGHADFALCGGADALSRRTFATFHRLGLIAPDVCRPFDSDRKGILTGEGAAVLMLESLDSALARGATIHAEVLGYGLNCDAWNPVSPLRASVARCVQLALDDARVKPGDVDLISAHGTGTKLNDVTECEAIRDVYGDDPPPTVSIKSMLGHTMGAASALAAVACALAITGGFIPPTINHRVTDPACGIDCVANHAVDADLQVVQNNGLAFGGDNAVLVLGKYGRTV